MLIDPWLWLLSLLVFLASATTASQFDPYQLNGGLVSAVAGKDYIVIASDTRMVGPGGYDILERNHLSSRIWEATEADGPFRRGTIALPTPPNPPLSGAATASQSLQLISTRSLTRPPVWIGSAGCQADCEMLKRTVRADLRSAVYFVQQPQQAHHVVSQVATLLGQILYSRRGFPFYSFCVVAGMDHDRQPKVYVYDAIGSSEQVAVASSGTGRELLQPILDRKFRSRVDVEEQSAKRMQAFGHIPLQQVDCSKDEAVSILLEGYRAVAEREIGVGDQVAFCVMHCKSDGGYECQVWSAPLKNH